MFCPECGAPIANPNAHFCMSCGKSLAAAETVAGTSQMSAVAALPMPPPVPVLETTPSMARMPIRVELPEASAPAHVHVKKHHPPGIIFFSLLSFVSAAVYLGLAMGVALVQGVIVDYGHAEALLLIIQYVPKFGPMVGATRDQIVHEIGSFALQLFFQGILLIAIGFGLWRLRRWGRILALVVLILAAISALAGLSQGLSAGNLGDVFWYLIVGATEGFIIHYFFKAKVRQAFATEWVGDLKP